MTMGNLAPGKNCVMRLISWYSDAFQLPDQRKLTARPP